MADICVDLLDKLREYDTPTICNVIELFDVRQRTAGYMDGRIAACFPELPPMVGFAATATFRSSGPPRAGDAYASAASQVARFRELTGPAIVVFQDLDDPPMAATFGEVMCTTYQAFGAVGLVTSGAGRDLEQVHRLGFPVFTGGTICAHGYCHILQVHIPVHVGGLVVYPDDLLHGDLNGVTTIPREVASEVPDVAREFIEAEDIVLEVLRTPAPAVKAYEEAVRETHERFAALRRRLSKKK